MTLPTNATIDQIITQLQSNTGGNQYAELVTQLTAKGVTLTGNETMYELVQKVGQIELGKKFAVGTNTISSTLLSINGLSFRPSIVIARQIGYTSERYSTIWDGKVNGRVYTTSSASSPTQQVLKNDGFDIYTGRTDSQTIEWIAFE